ncbi:MAG: RIP metalloprotease RseP, partial [Candidatus Azambacteria bacterium]|nr:RIP metalloprotease RseP [Candidatus Azambacteria bacterium]
FIGILALLIIAHEWGHFIVARKAGIRVDEFGFGFPPKILSLKRGQTEYSLNLIPLGGFVKIHGEDGEGQEDSDSFISRPVSVRIAVVMAGVTMNFLLAAVLLSFGFWYGLPQVVDGQSGPNVRNAKVTILQIAPGSPAAQTGIKVGDAIVGVSFSGVQEDVREVVVAQEYINAHRGQEITIVLERGSERLEKQVTPRTEIPPQEGALGVVLEKTGIVSYPWHLAIKEGVQATAQMTWTFLKTFYTIIVHLVSEGKLVADIAGPIGIGALTYQVTQLGFSYIIQFAAILAINLAIINSLPFPALDGGRFIFLLIEGIKGSPVSRRFEYLVHATGFALLILLMVVVTARDIAKLF